MTDAEIDRIADAVPVDRIGVHATTWHRRFARAVLAAHLARPDAEPVAYDMPRADGLILDVISPDARKVMEGEYTVPLYAALAAPAPAVPLTEPLSLKLASKRNIFQAGRDSYETPCQPMNTDDEAWESYLQANGIGGGGK